MAPSNAARAASKRLPATFTFVQPSGSRSPTWRATGRRHPPSSDRPSRCSRPTTSRSRPRAARASAAEVAARRRRAGATGPPEPPVGRQQAGGDRRRVMEGAPVVRGDRRWVGERGQQVRPGSRPTSGVRRATTVPSASSRRGPEALSSNLTADRSQAGAIGPSTWQRPDALYRSATNGPDRSARQPPCSCPQPRQSDTSSPLIRSTVPDSSPSAVTSHEPISRHGSPPGVRGGSTEAVAVGTSVGPASTVRTRSGRQVQPADRSCPRVRLVEPHAAPDEQPVAGPHGRGAADVVERRQVGQSTHDRSRTCRTACRPPRRRHRHRPDLLMLGCGGAVAGRADHRPVSGSRMPPAGS